MGRSIRTRTFADCRVGLSMGFSRLGPFPTGCLLVYSRTFFQAGSYRYRSLIGGLYTL